MAKGLNNNIMARKKKELTTQTLNWHGMKDHPKYHAYQYGNGAYPHGYKRPTGPHPIKIILDTGDQWYTLKRLTMPLEDAYIYVKALEKRMTYLPIYTVDDWTTGPSRFQFMTIKQILYNGLEITPGELYNIYENFITFAKEMANNGN